MLKISENGIKLPVHRRLASGKPMTGSASGTAEKANTHLPTFTPVLAAVSNFTRIMHANLSLLCLIQVSGEPPEGSNGPNDCN